MEDTEDCLGRITVGLTPLKTYWSPARHDGAYGHGSGCRDHSIWHPRPSKRRNDMGLALTSTSTQNRKILHALQQVNAGLAAEHKWIPVQNLPFPEVVLCAYAADVCLPSGLYKARGQILVLPALTDCWWWFESLLVHSGVSSATRRKATGADHKKRRVGRLWRRPAQHREPWRNGNASCAKTRQLQFLRYQLPGTISGPAPPSSLSLLTKARFTAQSVAQDKGGVPGQLSTSQP